MTKRIKKVQIVRVKAYGGVLSELHEVLAELPSIKMAEAAIREWQSIGHEAQHGIIQELSEGKPGCHFGCYVWRELIRDGYLVGYDRYWDEDFWHDGKEILTERIYTNIIR